MKSIFRSLISGMIVGFIGGFLAIQIMNSCSTTNMGYNLGHTSTYVESTVTECKRPQFDSICVAEKLPCDLGKWLSLGLKDYESKHLMISYSIYRDIANSPEDIIYTTKLNIQGNDTTFVFEKRENKLK